MPQLDRMPGAVNKLYNLKRLYAAVRIINNAHNQICEKVVPNVVHVCKFALLIHLPYHRALVLKTTHGAPWKRSPCKGSSLWRCCIYRTTKSIASSATTS